MAPPSTLGLCLLLLCAAPALADEQPWQRSVELVPDGDDFPHDLTPSATVRGWWQEEPLPDVWWADVDGLSADALQRFAPTYDADHPLRRLFAPEMVVHCGDTYDRNWRYGDVERVRVDVRVVLDEGHRRLRVQGNWSRWCFDVLLHLRLEDDDGNVLMLRGQRERISLLSGQRDPGQRCHIGRRRMAQGLPLSPRMWCARVTMELPDDDDALYQVLMSASGAHCTRLGRRWQCAWDVADPSAVAALDEVQFHQLCAAVDWQPLPDDDHLWRLRCHPPPLRHTHRQLWQRTFAMGPTAGLSRPPSASAGRDRHLLLPPRRLRRNGPLVDER